MTTSPGTPTNGASGGAYVTTSDTVSTFRTMLTHISELFTSENARSLAYINGLPSPSDKLPHKPLDVLIELEKRGVFSHENADSLISLLTDLHRVDIINTCGVREYKERAELAKLTRGDSHGSFNNRPNGFASTGRHQSLDTINTETSPTQSEGVANLPGGVAQQKRANSMGGVAGRNSNTGEEEFTAGNERRLFDLSLHHPPSPLATQNTCSSSSSQESLPVTMTTASHGLADVSKAELIATLAADPEAVSLMREAVSVSFKQDTTNRELPPLYLRGAPVINGDEAQDQSEATLVPPTLSGQSDSLLSPPAEFNPSLTLLERQTSTTYTQTDEGGATVSLTSSRATDCTSGYDSMKTASPTQEHHPTGPDTGSVTNLIPEFDSKVQATSVTWKVKRLNLCEGICKHSSRSLTKDVKLPCTQWSTPRKCRRLRKNCDPIKLTFHLTPYGIGQDQGSFMTVAVGVHVDRECPQLKEMATLHLKITSRFPPTEFVTVKTAANRLEDFVLYDFIPHDVVINQNSKNVELCIQTYLTFVNAGVSEEEEKKIMDSMDLEDVGDDIDDQFVHVENDMPLEN